MGYEIANCETWDPPEGWGVRRTKPRTRPKGGSPKDNFEFLTLASHLSVLGTFGCSGKVKQKIIDELLQKAEHRAWAEEAQAAADHPNATDLEDGKDWARWMVARAYSHLA